MSLDKPIEAITEQDLQSLVDEAETESRSLDYKQMLNFSVGKAKEDFRKDVTAFANSAGGHLIIGVMDVDGVPQQLCGFDLGVQSQEQYRLCLLEIIQSHIKPRIQGITIRVFQLLNAQWVAVIRVPRSFAKPHQVEIGNKDFQFWFRHDGGNQRMDVDEIKDAVLVSDTLSERIRNFRLERVGSIFANDTPIVMKDSPKLVLHIIPLSAFGASANYDVTRLGRGNLADLSPICGGIRRHQFNFDGFLTCSRDPSVSQPNCYLQVFRNGIIESVDGLTLDDKQTKTYPATIYEHDLLAAIPRFLKIQNNIGVEAPLLLMVSLLKVAEFSIVRNPHGSVTNRTNFGRENLITPEVMLESFDEDIYVKMRPVFDTIWNSGGHESCPNYDRQGNWH